MKIIQILTDFMKFCGLSFLDHSASEAMACLSLLAVQELETTYGRDLYSVHGKTWLRPTTEIKQVQENIPIKMLLKFWMHLCVQCLDNT